MHYVTNLALQLLALIFVSLLPKGAVCLENPWEDMSMWRSADELQDTTPNLHNYFLKRCNDFFKLNTTASIQWVNGRPQCADLWNKFSRAWIGRDECDVPSANFHAFLHSAASFVPKDKAVFWSGVRHFVNDCMVGKTHYVIENTLAGYVLGEAKWCGSKSSPTKPAAQCAGHWRDNCSVYSLFAAMSTRHAHDAHGQIVVLLNGGVNPGLGATGYSNSSQFAKFELPNLNKGKAVAKVTAWLLIANGDPKMENCANGKTIRILKDQVAKKGFQWECIENPKTELKKFVCTQAGNFLKP